MPANLPPDYHAAEQRYREARTPAEKIEALEDMLRIMPKHKGTDRLQGDIKARIAKLRREPAKKGAKRGPSYALHREGAGQVVLVGTPNTGKSSLVRSLTHASPEVGAYPFTTHEPVPGMMPFENVAIQLIDLPPLSDEHVEPWFFDVVRRADLFWIVVDGADPVTGIDDAQRLLRNGRIEIFPAGSAPPGDLHPGWTAKKAVVVATGLDREGAEDNLRAAEELLDRRWPIVPVSCATGEGLDVLRRVAFEALEIVRVYTKQPGKPPDLGEPFTLPRGATIADLAERIHKDILHRLRFARIWGKGVFDGQTVQRDHVLSEGDVVEIHA
jgi:hypothetical protein